MASADGNDLEAWLRLALTERLGGAAQRRLLSDFGSPEAVFAASHAELARRVDAERAAALRAGGNRAAASRLLGLSYKQLLYRLAKHAIAVGVQPADGAPGLPK